MPWGCSRVARVRPQGRDRGRCTSRLRFLVVGLERPCSREAASVSDALDRERRRFHTRLASLHPQPKPRGLMGALGGGGLNDLP